MRTNIDDEFSPEPEEATLRELDQLVKRAGELKFEISDTELSQKARKNELQNICEKRIPEIMQNMGGGFTSGTFSGFKVELKPVTYAGIPSESAIDKEKDENVKADMQERREKALLLLDEKAPHLLKRSFDIEFDRDSTEEAEAFEKKLQAMPDAPRYNKTMNVHPRTLAKWVDDVTANDKALTAEQKQILGASSKIIAKITK